MSSCGRKKTGHGCGQLSSGTGYSRVSTEVGEEAIEWVSRRPYQTILPIVKRSTRLEESKADNERSIIQGMELAC